MATGLNTGCTCQRSVSASRPQVSARCRVLRCAASCQPNRWQDFKHKAQTVLPAALAAAVTALSPAAVNAVSGGGGLGGSLAYQNLSGKDFQQVKLYKADLRGTDFSSANLTGANLFGAFAKDAHFKGANLRLAVLESVDFENADLQDAVLEGAQVTSAQFKNTNIAGTDWTDVILRKDQQRILCKSASGTNPSTGVSTRESLAC